MSKLLCMLRISNHKYNIFRTRMPKIGLYEAVTEVILSSKRLPKVALFTSELG